ncbi:hypothetical protein VDGL01_06089 [Verticillium dahliae]
MKPPKFKVHQRDHDGERDGVANGEASGRQRCRSQECHVSRVAAAKVYRRRYAHLKQPQRAAPVIVLDHIAKPVMWLCPGAWRRWASAIDPIVLLCCCSSLAVDVAAQRVIPTIPPHKLRGRKRISKQTFTELGAWSLELKPTAVRERSGACLARQSGGAASPSPYHQSTVSSRATCYVLRATCSAPSAVLGRVLSWVCAVFWSIAAYTSFT